MSGLPVLSQSSPNRAGRKRKVYQDPQSVIEGAAEEWASAKKRQKSRTSQSATQDHLALKENRILTIPTKIEADYHEQHQRSMMSNHPSSIPSTYATRFRWVADPKKLPPGKKRKYYGVRIGHRPGIFYSWDEAEAQVSGFPGAVHNSSTDASLIEDFMNHEPGDCKWRSCGSRCRDASQLRALVDVSTDHVTPVLAPHSSLTATQPTAAVKTCHCSDPGNASEEIVRCANDHCGIGAYHKKCVGLSSRRDTSGWRCFPCRPKTISETGSSSQALHPSFNSQSMYTQPSLQSLPMAMDPLPLLSHEKEPPLHPEQEAVVRCIEEGHNVFYTGSAGTGKSTVLKAFVKRLKSTGKKVDIVAPSGIAALNVGGMTIFSYASWRPDTFKDPLETLLKDAHGKKVRKKLAKTDVLVVDEISMVERDLFSRLDAVMREARHGWRDDEVPRRKQLSAHNSLLPFGGCQIIVTGDFCQLPPVKPFHYCMHCGGDELPDHDRQDGRPLNCKRCARVFEDADKWAFRSEAWEACNFTYFELAHVHRQNDQVFVNILQKYRLGKELLPSEETLLLKSKPDPPGAVRLLPRKREVEDENAKNYDRLRSAPRAFECLDVFSWRNKDEPELRKYERPLYGNKPNGPLLALKDHRFEENIQLKTGMLVILLQNLSFEDGLVNGSQGKIVAFSKYDPNQPILARPTESSPSKSGRRQKDNSTVNERIEFKEKQIRIFMERSPIQEWPIVEFHNGVTRPIYADCQLSELGVEKPFSLLGRTQIPLLAAWAITIHKSQGMTLDRVIVDLYNSFEREMVYVALSRARNLEGLKVLRLPRNKEKGRNAEVEDFLNENFGRGATAQVQVPVKLELAASEMAEDVKPKSTKSLRVPKRMEDGLDSLFGV